MRDKDKGSRERRARLFTDAYRLNLSSTLTPPQPRQARRRHPSSRCPQAHELTKEKHHRRELGRRIYKTNNLAQTSLGRISGSFGTCAANKSYGKTGARRQKARLVSSSTLGRSAAICQAYKHDSASHSRWNFVSSGAKTRYSSFLSFFVLLLLVK